MSGLFVFLLRRASSVLLAIIGCVGASTAQSAPMTGFAVHLHYAKPAMIDDVLSKAAAGRAKLVRWDAVWQDVERQRGQFTIPPEWDYAVSRASARGIQTILNLDYGNTLYDAGGKPLSAATIAAFGRYVRAVATHFRGKVSYYEIWNEWDGRVGGAPPGDAASYMRLVQQIAPIIRAADPVAHILAGSTNAPGLDSYRAHYLPVIAEGRKTLSRMLDLGLLKSIDGLSIHPYVYGQSGDTSAEGYRALLSAIVTDVRARTSSHGFPIFVTEVGWATTSAGPFIVTPQEQAIALRKAQQYSATFPEVRSFVVYQLQDPPTGGAGDKEANFGVLDKAGKPKPAFFAMGGDRP